MHSLKILQMKNENKINTRNLIQLIFFLTPFICFSQMKISGKIRNGNEDIGFANIMLQDQTNKTIKETESDITGFFELVADKGNYKLVVRSTGYDDFSTEIIVDNDSVVLNVVLVKKQTALEEVVVLSSPKRVKRKIDRTVVNIENSPIASSGNAFDALRSAPGLLLKNGEISIIGKSAVKVMVDGRLISLSGEDLKSFLNSIPANEIKEIEVITAPPAKYEVEGSSGLVNIILKKGKANSWNNSTSLSHKQAMFGKESLTNSFNYQKDKISVLLSLGYDYGYDYVKEVSEVYYTEGPNKISLIQKAKINDFAARFLLDYDFTKSTKLGVQYMGGIRTKDSHDDLGTDIFNNEGTINSYLRGYGNTDVSNKNHSLNIHLEQKLDTIGRKMFVDLDFFNFNRGQNSDILSNQYKSDYEFVDVNFANQSDSKQQTSNYNVKIDFEHPLKFVNLSYGAKLTFSNTKYDLNNYNTITGSPVFNPLQSNQFQFIENIQAAYLNGVKKLSDKWELQLGIRSEYTQTEGESKLLNLVNKNDYLKFFPTLYLSFKENENNTFMFNYSKRINRPNYSQLNPARYYVSSQLFFMGNPYLTPAYNNSIELTHVYKSNLTTKLAINIKTNSYNIIYKSNDTTNEQVATFQNFYTNNNFALTESYQFKIAPWWKLDASLLLNYSHSKKTNDNLNAVLTKGFEIYGSVNNFITFNESKSIIGEINFWYDSPYNNNIYHYSQSNSLDLAVTFKSFLKNFNLTTGVYDLFHASPVKYSSEVNGIKQNVKGDPSSRYFRISLVYNFGNNKVVTKERRVGNEDERRRSN